MCVVAPRCAARKRSRKPSSSSPSRNSGVRADWAAAIASTTPAKRRRRRAAIQQRQRVCEQRPAGRRRRVGENLTIAVVAPSRARARSRGSPRGPRRSASRRGPTPSRTPPRPRLPCRRARRPPPQAQQRVAELGIAQQLTLPRARARAAPTAQRTRASRSTGRPGSPPRRPARCSARPRPAPAAPRARSDPRAGTVPHRLTAAHTPAGAPYTPHEAGPMWKTCAASPNDTSIACKRSRGAVAGAETIAVGRRLHEEVEQRRAPRRHPPPACSRRRPARSAAARQRTTSASPPRPHRPRCRLPAAPSRRPRPSADAQPPRPPSHPSPMAER